MKKYIIILSMALAAAACSSDYLDTEPQDETQSQTILSNTQNLGIVINGISRMMTTQYLGSQGFNGEGTIKTWYGNYPGNDFQKCNLTGWSNIINHTYHQLRSSSYTYYPWYYYYKVIGNANRVIIHADDAEGPDDEKAFLKAQALTYRAYAYLMLSQLYCHRWSDDHGNTEGLVLRLDESTGDCPLSTLAQTYEQIYKDLDEAISLYQKSGLDRDEDEFYKPNINVAYAVYARAAITREDWANAAKYAALARKGHELMTNEQYAGGMHTPNNEWIFGVYEANDQTLHYYSFFAYQGSNSSASICRNYPCAISKELIDQIPATDVRRNLFLVPSEAELKECNSAGRSTKKLKTRAFKEYGNKLYSTSYVFAYMQFKLTADFMPGGGSFPLFRSAEMYYIEAEADCHLGKDAEAQKLLFEANQERDPELKKSEKTGADLLTEVKLYRRFDLWGEGYDWFDYKRWGQPINRKALNVKKGLESPGSFHSSFAKVINPEDQNDWTWMIPEKETDYNGAFKNGDSTED